MHVTAAKPQSRTHVPLTVVALGLAIAFIAALAVPVTLDSNSAQAPTLVENGSFEQPLVTHGGYAVFAAGQAVEGWRVIGEQGSVGEASTAFVQNGIRFVAKDGEQWLDLTGSTNTATGVEQTFATKPGADYRLTFSVGNVVDRGGLFGVTSTIDVVVNGRRVLAATNAGGGNVQAWKTYTLPLRPRSAETTIAFLNGDPDSDNSNGLDAVQLVKL